VAEFLRRLSVESRWRRFFSIAMPTDAMIASLCDSADAGKALALLVTRLVDSELRVIAMGSYHAVASGKAEVAFAVEDAHQRKGLGTLLLERLAVLAVEHAIGRLCAVTQPDNALMARVFRDSGYQVGERYVDSCLEVDLSLVPSPDSVGRSEVRDRVATVASLRPFFRPRAIAVIGASRDPHAIGHRVLAGLLDAGFAGPVYPVNPRAGEIRGLKAFTSARELPDGVDLAIITVPAAAVLTVVDECASRGVRALVVISAGFAETGAAGRELQNRLVERVRGHGMRMVGPNCMGILNADPDVKLNATFAPVFPPAGRIAMSSQSGALGLALLAKAAQLQLGVSTFVSVGNKADVSGNDLLQYWEEDPGTDVILLYLESFGNPRRFARIARRVSHRKPIVAVKAGRTRAGSRAAGSHTAALAASDTAVEALFHQSGIIRAETLEEMLDLAAALGSQPLPAGRRVGIVTNAGGPAILCADACEAGGLIVPALSEATTSRLAQFLPAAAGTGNPVDMIASASAEQYARTVETLLSCGEVDALVVIYMSLGIAPTEAIGAAVQDGLVRGRAAGGVNKPVLACLMTTDQLPDNLTAGSERIPTFAFPEAAAKVLSKMAAYADWRALAPGVFLDFDDMDVAAARAVCRDALAQRGAGWLTAEETRQVLTAARLPTPKGGLARSADEAEVLARQIGFPVAVKLASHHLVHKTEIGALRLNVPDEAAVRVAFDEIQSRVAALKKPDAMEGVLVQQMVSGAAEVMVGVAQDPQFGALVAFGLGGIHVEILNDVCFRIAPLTDRDAWEMVRSIRGYRLLQGYRGHASADIEALEQLLLRVSRLVEEIPEVAELDLNPVFALAPGAGCCIADARISVRPLGPTPTR
jgi:acetyl coenzyme A synthetase (ADP forming)-like protein